MPGLDVNRVAKICKSSTDTINKIAQSASIKRRKVSSSRKGEFDFADAVTIVGCRLLKKRGFSRQAIESLAKVLNREIRLVAQDEDCRPMLFACETPFGIWLTTVTHSTKEALEIINASPQSNFVNCREIYHQAKQEILKNA